MTRCIPQECGPHSCPRGSLIPLGRQSRRSPGRHCNVLLCLEDSPFQLFSCDFRLDLYWKIQFLYCSQLQSSSASWRKSILFGQSDGGNLKSGNPIGAGFDGLPRLSRDLSYQFCFFMLLLSDWRIPYLSRADVSRGFPIDLADTKLWTLLRGKTKRDF